MKTMLCILCVMLIISLSGCQEHRIFITKERPPRWDVPPWWLGFSFPMAAHWTLILELSRLNDMDYQPELQADGLDYAL